MLVDKKDDHAVILYPIHKHEEKTDNDHELHIQTAAILKGPGAQKNDIFIFLKYDRK